MHQAIDGVVKFDFLSGRSFPHGDGHPSEGLRATTPLSQNLAHQFDLRIKGVEQAVLIYNSINKTTDPGSHKRLATNFCLVNAIITNQAIKPWTSREVDCYMAVDHHVRNLYLTRPKPHADVSETEKYQNRLKLFYDSIASVTGVKKDL